MDIRPMAQLQATIARQEDIKKQEQRDEKLRELSKRRLEEKGEIEQSMRDSSISATSETGNVEQLDVQPHLNITPDLNFDKTGSKPTNLTNVSYFKDPNLGAKIDISS
ncbi:MAG: hypothetical protein ACRCVN_02195 [Spirochaetia bacterium]